MRHLTLLLVIFIVLMANVLRVMSQDATTQTSEPILIYQSGQVISINPSNAERTNSVQFSATDFMPSVNLRALWTEYDKNFNRIYMIVEREPFNFQTGKQLRSMIVLNLTNSTEETLYTDYDLQSGVVSPDGTKLLIHQYKIASKARMPSASQVCVLKISTNLCLMVELKGIASQFVWLNESEFVTPLLGLLYLCKVDKIDCKAQKTLESIYVDRVSKTASPNQMLIAGQVTPYDGIVHYYYFDIPSQKRTELEQLRKTPIYNSDNLAVIQDAIGDMNLSDDGKYLVVTNQFEPSAIRVLDIVTGSQAAIFQGWHPQWIGNSDNLIDTTVQGKSAEVFTLDVETGKKAIMYTTDQPFNLIVP